MTKFIAVFSLLVFSLPAAAQDFYDLKSNPIVLSVNDPSDDQKLLFSLRRDEYEQGVAFAGGDVRLYLRAFLLNQFLDLELAHFLKDADTTVFYDGLLYHEFPINAVIEQQIHAAYENALNGLPAGFMEAIDTRKLRKNSGRQVVLNVLIERALKRAGCGRDDFTPARIRRKYDFYAALFHDLQEQHGAWPETAVLDDLIGRYPALSPLIVYPQVRLQGVVLPNALTRQFEAFYRDEIRNSDTAEEKVDAFKRAFDEAGREWPSQIIYIRPGWAEQGRGELLPEIEKRSIGVHRKQVSELYHYVSGSALEPKVVFFQWMGYRPPRLLTLNESVSAADGAQKSVFTIFKEALFLDAYARIKPNVESRILKKYRSAVRFSGVFDFNPYSVFDK